MKSDIIKYLLISFLIFSASAGPVSTAENYPTIRRLDIKDDIIKSLRNDIRISINVTKGGKDPDLLPELKFYKYTVKAGDTFWNIMTRASLNIDTLLSVNDLASPSDIYPGRSIYIPNMRGIIYQIQKDETVNDISSKHEVDQMFVERANKMNGAVKEYLFIPCGRLADTERSLFLGAGFANPLDRGRRTSAFGTRVDPFNRRFQFHCGIDLACPPGKNVYASRDGVVSFAGCNGGYGKLVIIKHKHGYKSYYGHLSVIYAKPGDEIKLGDTLGLTGNSGRSTGPHLHFEVRKDSRPINPGALLSKK